MRRAERDVLSGPTVQQRCVTAAEFWSLVTPWGLQSAYLHQRGVYSRSSVHCCLAPPPSPDLLILYSYPIFVLRLLGCGAQTAALRLVVSALGAWVDFRPRPSFFDISL